jgi:deoxyribonuclease-4
MGLQIFTGNPTGWARRAELPKELPAFRARMKEHGFGPLAVHAAYLANLAGPNPVFREKTVELLRHELRVAPEYGASFVNVHIGSHMGTGSPTTRHSWCSRTAQAAATGSARASTS